MDVRIRPAEARDRTLLMNLFNLYQNELGAYCEDFGSIDENGYFAVRTVDDILPFGDGVFPYIILTDGAPCGLIMVTDARYALNEAVYGTFSKNGVEMTYPHINVHMN